jgi:ATP-dependent protease ClpP protease subunit
METVATIATPPASDLYWTFASGIDQQASQRVGRWTAGMPAGQARLHLLFQSAGGTVTDGIHLYNFFRAIPRPMTIYASGNVASSGVIAYLGAATRYASARTTFMLHRTTCAAIARTAAQLQDTLESLKIDDARTDAIFRERTRLTKEHFDQLDAGRDLTFTAEEAVQLGLAEDIVEFSPPRGTALCSFDVPV